MPPACQGHPRSVSLKVEFMVFKLPVERLSCLGGGEGMQCLRRVDLLEAMALEGSSSWCLAAKNTLFREAYAANVERRLESPPLYPSSFISLLFAAVSLVFDGASKTPRRSNYSM